MTWMRSESYSRPTAKSCPFGRMSTKLSTVFRGPDALSRFFAATDEAWESITAESESRREGPDWVLGFGRIRARGRESGAELDVPSAAVYRFRDGLITAIRVYTNRADALADLGLAPEGDPA